MDSSVVSKLSDESLLVGLGSGDPDAARDFVRRFQHRVFGLTFSILRDRGAAEEAAQESFVRAWKHASAYDPRRGTVAAWLLTIARNVSINMLPARRSDPIDPEVVLALEGKQPHEDAAEEQVVDSERCVSRWLDSPPTSVVRWCWPSSTASQRERSVSSTVCHWAP
jgi:RNA polymerase sigma factor (sigma-70 family)